MELVLSAQYNEDFADIDGIFTEEHNLNNITTISNNFRFELNPIRADDEQNNDDRPEHDLLKSSITVYWSERFLVEKQFIKNDLHA